MTGREWVLKDVTLKNSWEKMKGWNEQASGRERVRGGVCGQSLTE